MSVRKVLTVVVILLFIGMSIPSTGTVVEKKSIIQTDYDGKTLYVGGDGPGNYTKIQDAIDNASDGDTVFVYDDSSPYYENVVVDKSINLIGENRYTTIIDGGGSDNVVYVSVDNVNVSGLTIQNSGMYPNSCIDIRSNMSVFVNNIIINPEGWGFDLKNSNYNSIYRNNIQSGRGIGIFLTNSFHITISENILTNIDGDCIWLTKSSDNSIYDNIISENYHGIYLRNSENNSINENIVYNNVAGMYFSNSSDNNTILGNTIASNQYYGIYSHSSDGVISSNTIISNDKGIRFYSESNNNRLYHNNFINNTISASDEGNNTWDNGYPSGGNYWDDYIGEDNDGDGIGDTPYNISGGNNQDRYPLMEPFVQYPEFDVSGRGGIGLKISITNVGDIAATNVEWGVSVKGGLFGLINLSENGSLNSLDIGESISLTLTPLGFGVLKISIEIDASYAEKQTFKGRFFIILFIVFPTIPPLYMK